MDFTNYLKECYVCLLPLPDLSTPGLLVFQLVEHLPAFEMEGGLSASNSTY